MRSEDPDEHSLNRQQMSCFTYAYQCTNDEATRGSRLASDESMNAPGCCTLASYTVRGSSAFSLRKPGAKKKVKFRRPPPKRVMRSDGRDAGGDRALSSSQRESKNEEAKVKIELN